MTLTADNHPVLIDNGDIARFIIRLKTHDWDLQQALEEERASRGNSRWCQLNTLFVALYAVLTGMEVPFTVKSTPVGNTHIVPLLWFEVVDEARDQHTDRMYHEIRQALAKEHPSPAKRSIFLRMARNWIEQHEIAKHPKADVISKAIGRDWDEGKELASVLLQ